MSENVPSFWLGDVEQSGKLRRRSSGCIGCRCDWSSSGLHGLHYRKREETPNDPKLSHRDPEARVCAMRREAKARRMPGIMAGAYAVTEPVELTAARR